MKPLPLSVLAAIPLSLLVGCAVPQASAPTPSQKPFALETSAPAAAVPASRQDAPKPIIIDLTSQAMIIPGTQFGTTNIPILAGGDVLAGSSVITVEPVGASPFVHCEDRTVAWATEPNAQGAGAWARPLQLVTFDPSCSDVASIQGHAIVVPRVVSEHQGEYGALDQWLTEGREILVVGESPYPDPNKGPITGGKLEWPDDRPVFLGSADYKG